MEELLNELIEHYEGLADCLIEGQEMVDSLYRLREKAQK